MKKVFVIPFMILAFAAPREGLAQSGPAPSLRAGAAKVDVTPAESELPKNYEGILDRLYSRAIVLESGSMTAALISLDAGGVPDLVWQGVTRQLDNELKIPTANILI